MSKSSKGGKMPNPTTSKENMQHCIDKACAMHAKTAAGTKALPPKK